MVQDYFFKYSFIFSFITSGVVVNEIRVDFTWCLVNGSKLTVFDALF